MAIQRDARYPGRWIPADADFPLGGPKNRTTAESKDGTYLEKDWISDYEAFFQSLMTNASLTANGDADTAQASQFYDALINVINQKFTRQATTQEALNGSNVDAYMPPDLVHAAFNQYGIGGSNPPKHAIDLDTWSEKGIFNVTVDQNGWPFTNSGGNVVIYRHGSSNYFNQIAFKANSIESKRRYYGNGWSPWYKEITEADKATTAQAEAGTNDDTYLTPLKGKQLVDVFGSPIRDFDELGCTMLCVLDQTSNASTYPGSILRGVTVGGSSTSGALTGTYRPMGFVLANSSDPLERTTVFQKIAE